MAKTAHKTTSQSSFIRIGSDGHSEKDLTHNMTGEQIQEILDTLIYESLAPIIRTSDAFDVQIVYLLGLTAKNRKRKLSALPHVEFINRMCRCLLTDDREKKIQILRSSKIERGFVYNFVVKFLKETEDYIPLYQKYLFAKGVEKMTLDMRLAVIEANVNSDRNKLFSVINVAHDYMELAYKFKNSVVSNYIKHAYKQAKSFCAMKGANFDFEDVYQNFLTAVTKAVDKYDCSKGALTSYINWWVLNAQNGGSSSDHGHEYGIAYSIPALHRKQMTGAAAGTEVNFGVSLDQALANESGEAGSELIEYIVGDEGIDVGLEHEQELNTVRYLAKRADINGIARLYLDIDEVFSKREMRKMLQIMQAQGTLTDEEGKEYKGYERRNGISAERRERRK